MHIFLKKKHPEAGNSQLPVTLECPCDRSCNSMARFLLTLPNNGSLFQRKTSPTSPLPQQWGLSLAQLPAMPGKGPRCQAILRWRQRCPLC